MLYSLLVLYVRHEIESQLSRKRHTLVVWVAPEKMETGGDLCTETAADENTKETADGVARCQTDYVQ